MNKIDNSGTGIAALGRDGDKFMAHVTTGEMVVPPVINEETKQRIRKEMNIINRDLDVWNRTRDRYLTADVEALQKFIKDYKG